MSMNAVEMEGKKIEKNSWKTGSIISSARSASVRSFKIITQAMRKLSKVVKPSKKNNGNNKTGERNAALKGEPVKSDTEKAAVGYQNAVKSSETDEIKKVVVDVGPVCVAKMVGAIETKGSKEADQKVKITKKKAPKWPPTPVADAAAKVVKWERVNKKTALPMKYPPAHEPTTPKTEPAERHEKSHQSKKTGNNETLPSPARQWRPVAPANISPEPLDDANTDAPTTTDSLPTPAAALTPASGPKRSYVTSGRLLPSANVRRTPAAARGPALWDDAGSNASTQRPMTATVRAPASRDGAGSTSSRSSTSTLRPASAAVARASTSQDDAASTSSWLTASTLRTVSAASRDGASSTRSGSSTSTLRPASAAVARASASHDDAASTSSWVSTSTLRSVTAASRDDAASIHSGSSTSTLRPASAAVVRERTSRDDAASTSSWVSTSTLRSVTAASRDDAASIHSGSSTSTLRPASAAVGRGPASTRSWMTTSTLRAVTAASVGSTVVKPAGNKNRRPMSARSNDEKTLINGDHGVVTLINGDDGDVTVIDGDDGDVTVMDGGVAVIDGNKHVEGSTAETDSRAGDFDEYGSEIFRKPAEERTLNGVQKALLAADRRAFNATSKCTIGPVHSKRCDAHKPRPVPHPLSFEGQERREAVFSFPKRKDRVEVNPNVPCLAERQQTAKKIYGNARPARSAPPPRAIGTSAYVNDKAKTWEINRRNKMLADKILKAKSSIPKRQ